MSMTELLLILAIGLVVLGPERLPALARSLGRAMREFRRATREIQTTLHVEEVRRTLKERIDLEEANGEKTPTEVTTSGKPSKPPAAAVKHDPDKLITSPVEGALPYRGTRDAEAGTAEREAGVEARLSPLPPPARPTPDRPEHDDAALDSAGTGSGPSAAAEKGVRSATSAGRSDSEPPAKPASSPDDSGSKGG